MNSVGPELPYHANQEWKIHYLNTNEIMSIAGHLDDVILYQIKLERVLQVNFISCQCFVSAIDKENFARMVCWNQDYPQ